ncbi:hypothetical protein Bca4012_010577 [Brassica carinata]
MWHSRKSFTCILSMKEAKMQTISWAIESLEAHRLDRVVLGIEDSVLVGLLERPKAWSSFKVESHPGWLQRLSDGEKM